MKQHIVNDIPGLSRVTTDSVRLYETPSGKRYPSVTSVTGILGKEALQEWRSRVGEEEANRVSARASSRGTRIHGLCEDFLNNKLTSASMFDQGMFNSIRPELDKIDRIHCLETALYSDKLQVAGTVDCIGDYNGRLSVIDFKTSGRVKTADEIPGYFMQCAAYSYMFAERMNFKFIPEDLVIIMGVDDHSPCVFIEKATKWLPKFIEVREDYAKLYNR